MLHNQIYVIRVYDVFVLLKRILFQIDKSNSNEVVLKSLKLSSSGTYRCEVSAEAPSFQTVFKDRKMITVGMLKRLCYLNLFILNRN